jgi:hypothetical protein
MLWFWPKLPMAKSIKRTSTGYLNINILGN